MICVTEVIDGWALVSSMSQQDGFMMSMTGATSLLQIFQPAYPSDSRNSEQNMLSSKSDDVKSDQIIPPSGSTAIVNDANHNFETTSITIDVNFNEQSSSALNARPSGRWNPFDDKPLPTSASKKFLEEDSTPSGDSKTEATPSSGRIAMNLDEQSPSPSTTRPQRRSNPFDDQPLPTSASKKFLEEVSTPSGDSKTEATPSSGRIAMNLDEQSPSPSTTRPQRRSNPFDDQPLPTSASKKFLEEVRTPSGDSKTEATPSSGRIAMNLDEQAPSPSTTRPQRRSNPFDDQPLPTSASKKFLEEDSTPNRDTVIEGTPSSRRVAMNLDEQTPSPSTTRPQRRSNPFDDQPLPTSASKKFLEEDSTPNRDTVIEGTPSSRRVAMNLDEQTPSPSTTRPQRRSNPFDDQPLPTSASKKFLEEVSTPSRDTQIEGTPSSRRVAMNLDEQAPSPSTTRPQRRSNPFDDQPLPTSASKKFLEEVSTPSRDTQIEGTPSSRRVAMNLDEQSPSPSTTRPQRRSNPFDDQPLPTSASKKFLEEVSTPSRDTQIEGTPSSRRVAMNLDEQSPSPSTTRPQRRSNPFDDQPLPTSASKKFLEEVSTPNRDTQIEGTPSSGRVTMSLDSQSFASPQIRSNPFDDQPPSTSASKKFLEEVSTPVDNSKTEATSSSTNIATKLDKESPPPFDNQALSNSASKKFGEGVSAPISDTMTQVSSPSTTRPQRRSNPFDDQPLPTSASKKFLEEVSIPIGDTMTEVTLSSGSVVMKLDKQSPSSPSTARPQRRSNPFDEQPLPTSASKKFLEEVRTPIGETMTEATPSSGSVVMKLDPSSPSTTWPQRRSNPFDDQPLPTSASKKFLEEVSTSTDYSKMETTLSSTNVAKNSDTHTPSSLRTSPQRRSNLFDEQPLPTLASKKFLDDVTVFHGNIQELENDGQYDCGAETINFDGVCSLSTTKNGFKARIENKLEIESSNNLADDNGIPSPGNVQKNWPNALNKESPSNHEKVDLCNDASLDGESGSDTTPNNLKGIFTDVDSEDESIEIRLENGQASDMKSVKEITVKSDLLVSGDRKNEYELLLKEELKKCKSDIWDLRCDNGDEKEVKEMKLLDGCVEDFVAIDNELLSLLSSSSQYSVEQRNDVIVANQTVAVQGHDDDILRQILRDAIDQAICTDIDSMIVALRLLSFDARDVEMMAQGHLFSASES